jgi:cell division protease FtsH
LIEAEVRKFVQDGYDLALKTITKNKKRFENLAQGLLEYETLTGAEIKKVMEGKALNRDESEDDSKGAGGAPSVTAIPKTKPKASGGGMEPEPAG